MGTTWWAPTLKPELSQGDVLEAALIGSASVPKVYLSKGSSKGGSTIWQESPTWKADTNEIGHFLGKGRITLSLVISHDCEIDKQHRNSRVLITPVARLESVESQDARNAIMEQRRHALLPLPNVPGIGMCYADFRSAAFADRKLIDACNRVTSMSDDGVIRVQAQLVGFFTRKLLTH